MRKRLVGSLLPMPTGEARTNGVVFEHAQRLVHTRPLHGAVVPGHGHGDEAHHDGARLRCEQIVSATLYNRIRIRASGRAATEPSQAEELWDRRPEGVRVAAYLSWPWRRAIAGVAGNGDGDG